MPIPLRAAFPILAISWLLGACSFGSRVKNPPGGEPVVLLHGLKLNAFTLKKISRGLKEAGYRTCRINYPSGDYPIDSLVVRFIRPKVAKCFPGETRPLNFVTHSMGGILVRRLATMAAPPAFGRVVMIAPPNHGSEVVDHLGDKKAFGWWNGPAGRELGTDPNSVPNRLGPPNFEFGIIAANKSIDPLFSDWIPGKDDGIISVESTKLPGMKDFVEVDASHTLILAKDELVRQVVSFLKDGRFIKTP